MSFYASSEFRSPKNLKADSDMSTPFDFDKLDYLNFDLIICIYVTAVYQRHLSGNISYTYLNKCTIGLSQSLLLFITNIMVD